MIIIKDNEKTYEVETIREAEEIICSIYREDDICMSEILASIEINGVSMETVAEMYMSLRNATGDSISMIDEEGNFIL